MENNNENNDSKKYKSVEELAREALAAIKESENKEERKNEQELKDDLKRKEAALKNEVERKIKRKLRRLEKEEEKKAKIDEVDSSFMVSWKNKDSAGLKYIGEYNEKEAFVINRGIYLFHLKITGDVLHEAWRENAHTSVNLSTLKAKADKILKESNKVKADKEKKDKKK